MLIKKPLLSLPFPKFILIGLMVLFIAYIPLAFALSPWFNASNVPVQVYMQASSDLKGSLCWGSAPEHCAPLVAHEPQAAVSMIWLSELPTFPKYDQLYLQFDQPFNIQFEKVIFDNPRNKKAPLFVIDPTNSSLIKFENVVADGNTWKSNGSARIILPSVAHQPVNAWIVWGTLVLITLFFVIAISFFWKAPIGSIGKGLFSFNERKVLAWLAIASLLHIFIVQNAQVYFNGGDTRSYLIKAVSLAETGTYDTGGFEYELNRLPGYPILLAAIFKLFGYQLTNVSLIQSILFCISVYFFTRSFRNFFPDWVLIGAGIISLFGPPQIWADTELLSESFFLSLCLGSLAVFLEYLRDRRYWLIILYGLLSTFAFFVRANGVILFVFPIIFLLKELNQLFKDGREFINLRSILKLSLPLFIVAGIALAFSGAWSVRNYLNRKYFGLTDYGNLTRVAGQFFSGAFDFRSILAYEWRDTYFIDKYNRNNIYYVWDMRPQIYKSITGGYTKQDAEKIKQLDDILGDIYQESEALSPWQIKIVSYLRDFQWTVIREPVGTYDGTWTIQSYYLIYSEAGHQQSQDASTLISPKIIHDRRRAGMLNILYSKAIKLYGIVPTFFIIAAIISGIFSLRKNIVSAAPFLLFSLNILLYIYLRNISLARYIDIFLPFYCFQIVFCLYQIYTVIRQLLRKSSLVETSGAGV